MRVPLTVGACELERETDLVAVTLPLVVAPCVCVAPCDLLRVGDSD